MNDSLVRPRRNIGSNTESQEDLLQESQNSTNQQDFEEHKHGSDNFKLQRDDDDNKKRFSKKSGRGRMVDRVHSIIAPQSFKTPEKFLVEPVDTEINNSSWLEANFPLSAETVTIQRGEKGFGFIMVEEKVNAKLQLIN